MASYKTVSDLVLRTIAGSYILVAVGNRTLNDNKVIELSETGAFLWKMMMERACTCKSMAVKLAEEYEISCEEALKDTEDFCRILLSQGLLDQAE